MIKKQLIMCVSFSDYYTTIGQSLCSDVNT